MTLPRKMAFYGVFKWSLLQIVTKHTWIIEPASPSAVRPVWEVVTKLHEASPKQFPDTAGQ